MERAYLQRNVSTQLNDIFGPNFQIVSGNFGNVDLASCKEDTGMSRRYRYIGRTLTFSIALHSRCRIDGIAEKTEPRHRLKHATALLLLLLFVPASDTYQSNDASRHWPCMDSDPYTESPVGTVRNFEVFERFQDRQCHVANFDHVSVPIAMRQAANHHVSVADRFDLKDGQSGCGTVVGRSIHGQ